MADLGGLGGLLQGFGQVQAELRRARESLAAKEVEGQAGGGMVVVRVNGGGDVLAVSIDPKVVDRENVEVLEDLVRAAVRQAMARSREMMQQEMSKVTGGLGLPGIDRLLDGP